MASSKRNPISPEALTDVEIRENMRFLWFTPGDDEAPFQWGVFTSDPYMQDGEHYVVDCVIGEPVGEPRTVDLYNMGIVNSRYDSDQWATCITKAC